MDAISTHSVLDVVIELLLPELIHILELMGIVVIMVGAVRSLTVFVYSQIKPTEKSAKLILGKTLELGLEYKMGAEILKTVLIRDMSEIWILGSIIILRALLFALLHFEMRMEVTHGKEYAEKSAPETNEHKESASVSDNEE
jgi:uncharacterized membrane protein